MKKPLKILAFNIALICVLLLIAEMFFRTKGDTYTWAEIGGKDYVDPWIQNLDSRFQIRKPGVYEENYPEFKYKVEVNEDGIRGKTIKVEKSSNTLRVLGLGDSFMEGMGAPYDSTIMSLLEDKLNHKYPARKFESMPGGVAGSDVFRAYNLFEMRLKKYNPDLVIVLVNNTDYNDWLIKGNEEGNKPRVKVPSKLSRTLFEYSHLYRSITINLLRYDWMQQSPKEQAASWQMFQEDFEKVVVKYLTLSGGTDKLLFVFHPLVHEYRKSQYYFPFENLFEVLNQNKIAYLNTMPCIKAKDSTSSSLYYPLDAHFTPYGYSLISDCIIESYSLPQTP